MKKFLLSIFAVMLAVFSVQAEEKTGTITFKISSTDSGSAATKDNFVSGQVANNGGFTLSCAATSYCYTGKSGLKMSSSSKNGSFTLGLGSTYNVKSIKVNALRWKSSEAATISVNSSSAKSLTETAADYVFEVNSEISQIKLDVTKRVYVSSITVVYEVAGGGEGGETPETPVAPAAPTLTASCSFDDAMTVEITDVAEGATAYYSLNNETDWVVGTSVTIKETTTVYAKVVKGELSSDIVSATYTKNEPLPDGWKDDVLNRELTGVANNGGYSTWSGKIATSLAVYAGNSAGGNDAIQLRSNNSNSGIVTTKSGGKAKKIVVEWNSGTSNGRTLDVYGKNSAYSAATDLYSASTQGTKLGSIVYGTSTELVINGDYEFIGLRSYDGAMYLTSISITWDASNVVVVPDAPEIPATSNFVTSMNFEIANFGAYEDGTTVYYSIDGGDDKEYTAPFPITTTCEIVAYAEQAGKKSAVVRAEYTRIAKDPKINVLGDADADAFEGSIEVEITTENGAVAYYTLNGEEPTVESTKYEGALTIKATATLKVIAVEEGEYESGVTTKDFVMAVTGSDNIEGESCTLSFSDKAQRTEFSTSKQVWKQNGITLTNNKGTGSNVADYAAPARFYKNSEIIVEFTSPIAKIEFACNTSEYATALKNSIPGSTASSKTVTVQLDGSSNSFTIGNLSGQVRMDALTVTPMAEASASSFNLTIGNAGWATLFLDYAVAIPEGVTCYVIEEDAIDGETVELTDVYDVIPANTGVIVQALQGEYVFEPTDEENEVKGLMQGTTSNKYIFDSAYVLGVDEKGVVGLYKADMAGGVWLNNANKAYLPMLAGAEGIKSYSFRFGEGTTGINEVTTESGNVKGIYDLTGRRVEAITAPGIYIVGGKKVLVK